MTSLLATFKDSTALITGASSGIGQGYAKHFASLGINLILTARTEQKLIILADELTQKYNVNITVISLDLSKTHAAQTLFEEIQNRNLSVNILINNAGSLVNKPFLETTAADLAEMLESNVMSHFKMIKACVPIMQSGSHIVNVGSMGGFQGSVKFPGLSAYSASKAALHTLSECLAFELADKGIKVNCLALGSAQTEMLEAAFPGYESPVMAFEMGKYIADFAKTGHKFFNGKILPVAVTTP